MLKHTAITNSSKSNEKSVEGMYVCGMEILEIIMGSSPMYSEDFPVVKILYKQDIKIHTRSLEENLENLGSSLINFLAVLQLVFSPT